MANFAILAFKANERKPYFLTHLNVYLRCQ